VANVNNNTVVKIPSGGGNAFVLNLGSSFTPYGVAVDGAGNLFVSNFGSSTIQVMTPGGVNSQLNINGLTTPYLDLPISTRRCRQPVHRRCFYSRVVRVSGIVVAGSTSSGNGTVVRTGSYTLGQSNDGVAVNSKGTLYLSDSSNNRIIQVTAAGAASLLTTTGITFNGPYGISIDSMDNLYVADRYNARIVFVTSAGVASVVAFNGLSSPPL